MEVAQESIYNLVPQVHIVPPKPPMYHSKFDPKTTPIAGSTFGCSGSTLPLGAGHIVRRRYATLGPPSKQASEPQHFLRKGTNSKPVPSRTSDPHTFKYGDDEQRKPRVPTRTDKPVMGLKTNKNFITANAVEAILAVPKGVDNPEPNYLKKADYGKVPQYLGLVKEEIKRENDMIDQYVKEQMGLNAPKEQVEEMNEQERRELINALKTKWDAVNAKYQKITHMVKIESFGLLKRKESLEKELKQLETDISLLERHGPVLVRAG